MTSRLSERGQITIDQTVRELLGLQPGMIAYQRVIGGHLEVVFLPAPHRRSLFGALRGDPVDRPVITRDDINEAVMEAVAEELEASDQQDV